MEYLRRFVSTLPPLLNCDFHIVHYNKNRYNDSEDSTPPSGCREPALKAVKRFDLLSMAGHVRAARRDNRAERCLESFCGGTPRAHGEALCGGGLILFPALGLAA
ncbi:hypothetical protein RRG08_040748 [Elysia crispata]|uniref:Uncharacterized protein n=1 Tax=Elysia crispata TaxID=231223 RepID=A0AAE1EE71_9GAST|nr:hypothetical protein RRG08_040748 [Elysia crispata]